MRTTGGDFVVMGLTAAIFGGAALSSEPSGAAAWGGAIMGFLLGALFCTFVRLATSSVRREVESLRVQVEELERELAGVTFSDGKRREGLRDRVSALERGAGNGPAGGG